MFWPGRQTPGGNCISKHFRQSHNSVLPCCLCLKNRAHRKPSLHSRGGVCRANGGSSTQADDSRIFGQINSCTWCLGAFPRGCSATAAIQGALPRVPRVRLFHSEQNGRQRIPGETFQLLSHSDNTHRKWFPHRTMGIPIVDLKESR